MLKYGFQLAVVELCTIAAIYSIRLIIDYLYTQKAPCAHYGLWLFLGFSLFRLVSILVRNFIATALLRSGGAHVYVNLLGMTLRPSGSNGMFTFAPNMELKHLPLISVGVQCPWLRRREVPILQDGSGHPDEVETVRSNVHWSRRGDGQQSSSNFRSCG